MAELDIDSLNAMSADELAERLAGSPEERAAIVRTAAEADVAQAQALYGQMLLDGVGVAKDERAALAWFAKAANQNHILAINMVGRCYELGWGTPVGKARAAQWYKAAADRGLDWGMYNYATLLALGEGVAEDKRAALDWFRKAAGLGNAKSMNYIGSFYEDGWVVERDLDAAEEQYRMAAEGGDFRGQFNYARLRAEKGDVETALAWLARVRETGTPAFMDKAEHWLRGSPIKALRDRGIAALLHGVETAA